VLSRDRIVVGKVDAAVYCLYALRHIPSSIPGRRWDPVGKCWRIPTWAVEEVAAELRAAGREVRVTLPDGSRPHWTPSPVAGTWADQLFGRVRQDRIDAVHRALVKVLHPDRDGGSTELMADLNTARDRAVRG
jgi:hypothetical protein